MVDDVVVKLRERVQRFSDAGDAEMLLTPEVEAELDRAAAMAGQRGDPQGGGAAPRQVELDEAIGWLRWCRYLVTGWRGELDQAISRFSPESGLPQELATALAQLTEPTPGALDHDESAAIVLFDLSGIFYERFQATGDPADLDNAVDAARSTAIALSRGHSMRVGALHTWGGFLQERTLLPGGDPARILEARDALAEALVECRIGEPMRPALHLSYVYALAQAARLTDTDDDVLAIVRAVEAAVAEMDLTEPLRAKIIDLATSLVSEFDRAPERSTALMQMLVTVLPAGDHRRSAALFLIGSELAVRGSESGDVGDLDRAESLLAQVADDAESQLRPLSLSLLGDLHLRRWELMPQHGALDEGVRVSSQAVDLARPDDPHLPYYLTNLAGLLVSRYEEQGRTEDLDRATSSLRSAVDAPEPGVRVRALHLLGKALRLGLRPQADLADLDEAVELHRRAVALAETDPDAFGSYDWWEGLAEAHSQHHEMGGRDQDLDDAVAAIGFALAHSPPQSPDYPRRLILRVTYMVRQAERSGSSARLRDAVAMARLAVAARPTAEKAALSLALASHFAVSGVVGEIDEAITIARAVAAELSPGHRDYLDAYSRVGAGLITRFERLRRAADIEESVGVLRNALRIARTSRGLPLCHANLGNALRLWFQVTGDPAQLDEAVELLGDAARGTSPGGIWQPGCLTNLAAALMTRFRLRGQVSDVDGAIDAWRTCLLLIPTTHVRYATYQSNLASALVLRNEQRVSRADVDEAIELARAAVEKTTATDQRLAAHLLNLGAALRCRSSTGAGSGDLIEALAVLRAAAQSQVSPAWHRVQAAEAWAAAALDSADDAEALQALETGVELLPLVVWRGLDRADQERELAGLAGIASDAAAVALRVGRPALAVELLEHGRAVLWGQMLELRTDLTRLRELHPHLAARMDEVRAAIDTSADTHPVVAHDRVDLALEWDNLIGQARQLEGFGGFLRAPAFAALTAAAAAGPVVIVNVSRLRCDALILSGDSVRVVPLPELTASTAATQARVLIDATRRAAEGWAEAIGANTVLTGVLAWMWRVIVGPVLVELGSVERVWWCPTGPLALLPLHAAGEAGGASTLDKVVSSYAPTLRGLLAARETAIGHLPGGQRMLVVAVPQAQGAAPLDVTGEVDLLTDLLPGACTVRNGATWADVVSALPRHPWVHFACHGATELADPSSAALVLSDRRLTVMQISRLRLASAEFAYLSACDTAVTGTTVPDESIHLAAALQLCGYRRIVATMWSVSDVLAAPIATIVYREMARGGVAGDWRLDATRSAYALRAAVQAIRADGNQLLPMLWAPYIHVGP